MIVWEITGFDEGGIAIIAAETADEARSILQDALGIPRWWQEVGNDGLAVKPWGGVLIVTVGKP